MKATSRRRIATLERALGRDLEKLAALKRRQPSELVADYTLQTVDGPVRLSALFSGRRDLIVIHNMGRRCRYCTLWADGFNGLYPHLNDRAAFCVVSPDAPAVQRRFAAARGWRFPLVSARGSTFSRDLGYEPTPDEPMPGVSTFRLRRGQVWRVATAPFGPFDPFCAVWPLFALLADGVGGWAPQYRY